MVMVQCYLDTILNDLDHHRGTVDTVCRQQVPFNTLTSPVSMMLFISLLIVAAESKLFTQHRVPAPTFILLSDNLLVVLIQNCLGGKQFLTEQDYRFNVSSSRIKQ